MRISSEVRGKRGRGKATLSRKTAGNRHLPRHERRKEKKKRRGGGEGEGERGRKGASSRPAVHPMSQGESVQKRKGKAQRAGADGVGHGP